MTIKDTALCFFSPTRSSYKIITRLSGAMALGVSGQSINLTSVSSREKAYEFTRETLLIVSCPTYGGRLPRVEPGLFANFRGHDTPAVAIVTYGGRGYDDALLELCDLLENKGFAPIAAAAFVAQHASSPGISSGRPDESDIDAIKRFGQTVRDKLLSGEDMPERPEVPGNRPYTSYPPKMPFSPITNEKCIFCMQCYRWCPTDAIPYYSPTKTEASRCVLCQGCVRRCPLGAREVTDDAFLQKVSALERALKDKRPEPEMFL